MSERGRSRRVEGKLVNELRHSADDLDGGFHQWRGIEPGAIDGSPLAFLAKAFMLQAGNTCQERLKDNFDYKLPID